MPFATPGKKVELQVETGWKGPLFLCGSFMSGKAIKKYHLPLASN